MDPNPVYATFADGHEEMLVGDAIAQSSRSGSWVTVDRGSSGAQGSSSAASPTLQETHS